MDNPPNFDRSNPDCQHALAVIRWELAAIRRDSPNMAPHQALREARRRACESIKRAMSSMDFSGFRWRPPVARRLPAGPEFKTSYWLYDGPYKRKDNGD
jgi:hypothetical protein